MLALVLVLGGAVRVAWVAHAGVAPHFNGDPNAYLLQGEAIARGEGYTNPLIDIENAERSRDRERPLARQPASFYPPGYPYFVAGVVWVVWHTPIPDGDIVHTVGYLQALLGMASILFVFLIARRAFGAGVALVAAAITAVYPNLVTTTATLQLESVFVFLSLATMWVLLPLVTADHPHWARCLAAGALMGVVGLERPTVALLLVAVVAAWIVARRPFRQIVRGFALLALAMCAVVAPWTIRNATELHAFVPLSTGVGPTICQSRNPETNGGLDIAVMQRECRPPRAEGETAAQFDVATNRFAMHRAEEWVLHHPLTEIRMWFARTRRSFVHDTSGLADYGLYMSPAGYRAAQRVCDVAAFAVLLLAAGGAIVVISQRRPAAVFVLVAALAYAAVPAILFGDPRYKVPAQPLFIILAAAAIGAAFTAVRRRAPGTRGDSARSSA